ncbi:hypothetical protein [Gulbenkiania mobilis]|uniref:hypothetical protein n=1 Tax=Gulbenkiania mobilis TaxID=397457 RepID=UPI0006BBC908|nr:hypothetical protein [Gulbenkiania mobilis]
MTEQNQAIRDEKGRFLKGTAAGSGRPPKPTTEERLARLFDARGGDLLDAAFREATTGGNAEALVALLAFLAELERAKNLHEMRQMALAAAPGLPSAH